MQSVTEGIDAMADVTIRIKADGDMIYTGRAAHTDIFVASTKAYLQALNKQIARVREAACQTVRVLGTRLAGAKRRGYKIPGSGEGVLWAHRKEAFARPILGNAFVSERGLYISGSRNHEYGAAGSPHSPCPRQSDVPEIVAPCGARCRIPTRPLREASRP